MLKQIREDVLAKESEFGILSSDHDSSKPLNFGLCVVVYKWANGESFKDIMSMTDVQEGIIVRAIQRLEELCREVCYIFGLPKNRTIGLCCLTEQKALLVDLITNSAANIFCIFSAPLILPIIYSLYNIG